VPRSDQAWSRFLAQTHRGGASIAHHVAHVGGAPCYKGLRKNQFDGRRHAAVSNLLVAAVIRRNVNSLLESY